MRTMETEPLRELEGARSGLRTGASTPSGVPVMRPPAPSTHNSKRQCYCELDIILHPCQGWVS